MPSNSLLRRTALACGLLIAATGSAFADDAASYPNRAITMIVGYPAGGSTDLVGRFVADGLASRLGQPVVVENRPGAGTVVAGALVAKAPPDGYTLLLGASTTLTLNPVIRNPLPYDPLRSFTPLGLVADMGLVLVAHNETPARTLPELVALAKADPDKLSYGSFGTGSSVHFGGEMLKTATGMRMVHVPFNGSSPSLTALMGGQVQVAVDTVVATTPLIKAGKIRPIAALGPQRLPLLPQVPTVAESGYPGFAMDTWFAFLAPAGLPAPIQKKLEKALADTMAEPAMKKKLVDIGLSPAWGPGSALQERIERELPQMRAVAARADIKVD